MDIPVRLLPHDGQECPSYIVPGNLCAGAYFTTPAITLQSQKPVPSESPLYDPLRAIGFQDAEITRILRSFPARRIVEVG